MTYSPLRVGIVGGGFMGRRHAETIERSSDFQLVGVADPYSDTLARERGVPSYSRHEDLMDGDLDAVIIANPNDAHVATALDAHARGITSLVEKPLSTSLGAMAPLLEVASEGAPILVGHHRRHHPSISVAQRALQDGVIGDVLTINGLWTARKADAYFAPDWRRARGAGVVLINAVHDLDLFRALFGEFHSVRAQYSSRTRGLEIPDTATVAFETESGALGTYICSDAAVSPWTWDQSTQDEDAFPFRPDSACYFVAGTQGSLTFPTLQVHHHPRGNDWNNPLTAEYLPIPPGDSYSRQLAHFADVARGAAAPSVTVSDVAETMRLMDAVQLSARTGLTVEMASLPR